MKRAIPFILILFLSLSIGSTAQAYCAPQVCACCPDNACGVCHMSPDVPDHSALLSFNPDVFPVDSLAAQSLVNIIEPDLRFVRLSEDAALTNLAIDKRGHLPHGPPLV